MKGIGFTSSDNLLSSAASDENLRKAKNFGEYVEINQENMISQNLSEHLMMLLDQKGLKRADVVRDSGLEKAYVYQIFSGEKNPSRDKLIAVAFGLHLNEKETQRMLKVGGYSELYPRIARDAAILFSVQHGESIWETDKLLYSTGYPTLHDSDK